MSRIGLDKPVEFLFSSLNQARIGKLLLKFINEPRPVLEKWRKSLLQMVKPFNGNSIAEIKSKEYDFVIVGRETDGVELNDAVDFAKERSDVFVLARKHPRFSNLD